MGTYLSSAVLGSLLDKVKGESAVVMRTFRSSSSSEVSEAWGDDEISVARRSSLDQEVPGSAIGAAFRKGAH